jgi:hypothetical protein
MNFENIFFQKFNNGSNFNETTLNPFLDKSKKEYPNSIVESTSDMVNIILLKKFPKKYDFKYEEAINLIEKFLKKIIPNYGLSEIKFNEDLDHGFNPSFVIKVPKNISSKDLIKYSDDIFNEVGNFANINNIEFILDDLSIILSR